MLQFSLKTVFFLNYLILFTNLFAQVEKPGEKQTEAILLLNGTAHLGNGQVIKNSAIAFDNGKITMVANAASIKIDFSKYGKVLKLEGKHIYPSFIAPNSMLGLTEIDAVRATNDYKETGKYNPHIRSITAYNTESIVTSTVRSNGVMLGQITPQGSIISGTSSIVQFDAWNWEDAVLKLNDGMHINWLKQNKNHTKNIQELHSLFADALAYSKKEIHEEKNLRYEAMRDLFSNKQTLFIHTNFIKEMTESVYFAKKYGIKKIVIVGGYDAWRITDFLKENNVSICLKRIHSLPKYQEEDVYLPYKTPKILWDAGILFCLENSGSMEAMGTRNLPFYAGTAVAYGMEKENALTLITLNTAKILGIDAFLGSLETGKDATLFISSGDALDMRTNNVELAFIQGRSINLNNYQKKLYEKFK